MLLPAKITLLFLFSLLIFQGNSKKKLYIGGFLPMSVLPGKHTFIAGPGVLPGLEIALELINRRQDILPDYELVFVWNDTKADGAVATKALFEFIYNEPTKIMVLGPLLSSTVIHIAAAAPAWNLLQISCLTRTPEMNERSKYPMFFRTLQEDSGFNIPRMRLLQKYNWKRVSMIYEHHSGNLYQSSIDKLSDLLTKNNVTVQSVHSVDNGPAKALLEIKAGMYGKKYVWIFPGWQQSQAALDVYMRRQECEYEDVKMVAEGTFFFRNPKQRLPEGNGTIYGLSFTDFEFQYFNRSERRSISEYALFGFDAVLSIALTLHEARKRNFILENFSYENSSFTTEFLEIMYNLRFSGITGPVAFDENGNRIGITEITQLQDGVRINVADHDPFSDILVYNNSYPVRWKGNRIPLDGTRKDKLQLYIPEYAFLPLALLSFSGMILAVTFLIFNIRKRNLKYIKLSSPLMNNIIVAGCILAYLAVILYGLDNHYVSADFFIVNCKLRIWILACAFSLAFGAMFSKTWRVHIITSKKIQKNVVVKDWHLILRIVCIVLVDFIYLTIWTVLDAFIGVKHTFADIVDPNDDDHFWEPEVEFCHSAYEVYWIGGIIVYKGLLLMLGLFLAWETRNIRIEALNDSKYIGICVYNVALMCIMGVPVGFLIGDENFVGGYVITSLFIILSTTITLCLVFVPKIIELRKNPFGDVSISINQESSKHKNRAAARIMPIQVQPNNAEHQNENKDDNKEIIEIPVDDVSA